MEYDIIIVGAGPIGLACAIEAKKAGLRHLVIDKGSLTNSIYNYPLFMTFFSTSDKIEIGDVPFVSIGAKPTRNEALEYYRRVVLHYELNILLFEKVEDISPLTGGFEVRTVKSVHTACKVIIATGFYDVPILMNIPGEDLPKVTHYYKDPHYYAFQKIVVVGRSNSAVDAALECYRKGADVTMVIRAGEIGPSVKYWVRPDIENRISEGNIKAYFHSSLEAVRDHEVDIRTPEGLITIPNNYVLAMTGYRPGFEWLRHIGVHIPDENTCYPVYNAESMETNIPGLYLAGVVCGGMDTHKYFIENSRVHAAMIVQHIRETI
jgi:thioredoxin reductase (NADPH)